MNAKRASGVSSAPARPPVILGLEREVADDLEQRGQCHVSVVDVDFGVDRRERRRGRRLEQDQCVRRNRPTARSTHRAAGSACRRRHQVSDAVPSARASTALTSHGAGCAAPPRLGFSLVNWRRASCVRAGSPPASPGSWPRARNAGCRRWLAIADHAHENAAALVEVLVGASAPRSSRGRRGAPRCR